MGNCLRKPMRDQDESGLIANAAKATPSLGFANDDVRTRFAPLVHVRLTQQARTNNRTRSTCRCGHV